MDHLLGFSAQQFLLGFGAQHSRAGGIGKDEFAILVNPDRIGRLFHQRTIAIFAFA